MGGTGTRWGALRDEGTEVIEEGDGSDVCEIDGMGGGDARSLPLNRRMKPLFFLTTVRGRAACSDENEGTGGIACGSEMTGLALELLAEADLILEDHV